MSGKKTRPAWVMAFGGIMAALAVVIMSLGGLIPVATYVCPILCMILLTFVRTSCGMRISWAWYGAVSFLSLLLCPDKEAAAVFVFIGFYPILKPWFDRLPLGFVWKTVFFNADILLLYWILMQVLGMNNIREDFAELGRYGGMILLLCGNLIFYILDRLLQMNLFGGRTHGR